VSDLAVSRPLRGTQEGVRTERPLGNGCWAGDLSALRAAPGQDPAFHEFGALFCLPTGEIEIVPLGSADDVCNAAATRSGMGVVFGWPILSPASGSLLLTHDAACGRVGPTWRECGGRLAVDSGESGSWRARIARLAAELRGSAPGSLDAAAALLTLMLVDAARLARSRQGPISERDLVVDAAAVIDRRFREPLSRRDVASAVAVSPSHLSRLMKLATGRSVGQWIRDRRMEEARHLLRDNDASVELIAAAVGYRDVTHFRRDFKRAHQMTPARWRERARPDLAKRVR
jgi:AraC-like DNA-binding protein